jgi:hypothetical protein
MKSVLVGTGHYICKVYNNHDSQACGYKRYGILSRLDGLGVELFGYGFGCNTLIFIRI